MEAANAAYAKEGYAGISMRQIAKQVGLTPMAIYRHFKDKDDLMHHVVLHGLSLFERELARAGDECEPWQRILAAGDAYVRFATEHRMHFEVTFLATDHVSHLRELTSEGANLFDQVFARYASWVGECVCRGAEERDVKELAVEIWAFTHGLVALSLAGRLEFLGLDFPAFQREKLQKFLHQKQQEWGAVPDRRPS